MSERVEVGQVRGDRARHEAYRVVRIIHTLAEVQQVLANGAGWRPVESGGRRVVPLTEVEGWEVVRG